MCCFSIFEKTIEVFKTNVYEPGDAQRLVAALKSHFPYSRINFDLHDCDKILRVEGMDFTNEKVMQLLQQNGFHCSVLE